MGCDIHIHAEVRKNGKWEKVDNKPFKNPYYREGEENKIDDDGYEWNPEYINEPYRGRNYDLFAILADVRNGRGFAGIKTGEGFNPISKPKGLPEDVSLGVLMAEASIAGDEDEDDNFTSLEIMERWVNEGYSNWIEPYKSCTNPDAHSESWLTLRELKEYDWNQFTMLRGSLSFNEYKTIKKNNTQPESWCGDIWGENIITIDEDEAEKILKGEIDIKEYGNKKLYVNYHWTELYRDCCKYFVDTTIPSLEKLGGLDDVRIVFWFDN